MVVTDSITLIYDNIGIILGFAGVIAGVIAKQARNHGWNTAKIDTLVKYVNEAHDFNVNNHDKFVGLVAASTDLDPALKTALEAHGADINKVVADSEQGKAALKKILDELNALTGDVGVANKK
jgi:hypothetical protein